MSLEDRQADAVGKFDETFTYVDKLHPTMARVAQQRFDQLNQAFATAYELDDEDDGDRAYDAVEALEEFVDDFHDEWTDTVESEHDGQPDEAQEWHDFDPDC